MSSKIERARARKKQYMELKKKVQELETQLEKTTGDKLQPRRGSISRFFREMLVDESRVRPRRNSVTVNSVADLPNRSQTTVRRGSITDDTSSEKIPDHSVKIYDDRGVLIAIRINDKHGKQIALRPANDDDDDQVNRGPLAKALQRKRGIVLSDSDVNTVAVTRPSRFVKNADGTLKKCTTFQKFFTSKCEKGFLKQPEDAKQTQRAENAKLDDQQRMELKVAAERMQRLNELAAIQQRPGQKVAEFRVKGSNQKVQAQLKALEQAKAAAAATAAKAQAKAKEKATINAELQEKLDLGVPPEYFDLPLRKQVDYNMKPGSKPKCNTRPTYTLDGQSKFFFCKVPPSAPAPSPAPSTWWPWW